MNETLNKKCDRLNFTSSNKVQPTVETVYKNVLLAFLFRLILRMRPISCLYFLSDQEEGLA